MASRSSGSAGATCTVGRPISAFSSDGVPSATIRPRVDDPDAVREHVRLLEVLRREEDGDAVLAGESRHLDPERVAALRIEPGRRLVEEEDRRPVQERERQVEAALHPARVRAHLAVRRFGQADALEQLVAAARALVAREAVQRRLQANVVAARQERVQRSLLERRADQLAHLRAVLDDVEPADDRAAAGGRHQRGQHVDGGRLPGPVRAEEAVDLPVGDLEIDPVDGSNGLELADEPLGDDRAHRETVATAGPSARSRHT